MSWTCRAITGNNKDGNSISKGKKITRFTNNEESAVGLTKAVPFLLENRMKELGGKFEKGEDFKPFVVTDGRLITGQNPASAFLAAEKVVEILGKA
jgi:putative intracellular protease/amidase